MVDTKTYDPSKLIIATKFEPERQENGLFKLDAAGNYVGGTLTATVYLEPQGLFVDSFTQDFTRIKYESWKEDTQGLSAEEFVRLVFPHLKLTTDPEKAIDKK